MCDGRFDFCVRFKLLLLLFDHPFVIFDEIVSGISVAGQQFEKRVVIVMTVTAARVKFGLARSFGAEIRTYDIFKDHETGGRDRLTRQIPIRLHLYRSSTRHPFTEL